VVGVGFGSGGHAGVAAAGGWAPCVAAGGRAGAVYTLLLIVVEINISWFTYVYKYEYLYTITSSILDYKTVYFWIYIWLDI
jgi:hypothetical protein